MTLGELGERMSSLEFELWQAQAMLKSEVCPNCGLEAKDMMDYELVKVKCPNCKTPYQRIRRFHNPWQSSVHQTPSED